MKIITIVGARPQFIKAAAISRAIRNHYSDTIEEIILNSGQHYDDNMAKIFFQDLGIPEPQHHLGIGSGTHGMQTGRMTEAIEKILIIKKPDAMVVYGDTNTTLAGALAASKLHIPVVHIEAGLRSHNKKMPEEINRILTDHVSTLLFSPTETGINNLVAEGFLPRNAESHSIDNPGIYHSGDIMLDNTLFFAAMAQKNSSVAERLNPAGHPYVLATIHRPSNTDEPHNLLHIVKAFSIIASTGIRIILPLHPRTTARLKEPAFREVKDLINNHKNIITTAPVSFLDMIMLEKASAMVITDSGGVQKEAYFLQKPCIIIRKETEWKEIVESGNARLCGADEKKIVKAFENYLQEPPEYFPGYFGDGDAARFICRTIINRL
jgi:UDP-GlcNAc3NAcA epimerase